MITTMKKYYYIPTTESTMVSVQNLLMASPGGVSAQDQNGDLIPIVSFDHGGNPSGAL